MGRQKDGMRKRRTAVPTMPGNSRISWKSFSKILENPKVQGFLALLAFAVNFSPKISAMASRILLALAWVLGTLTAWSHYQGTRGRRFLVTGICGALLAAVLVPFSFWLTHSKRVGEEQKKVLRSHLHIRSFQPSPVAAGKTVMLNVYYRNDGEAPAEVQTFYNGFLAEFPRYLLAQGELEDQLFEIMRNRIPLDDSAIPRTMIPVGAERWTTCFGPHLSPQQVRGLKEGKTAIYFVGVMRYRDSAGTHETSFCVLTHSDPVVFTCQRHNEEP